MRYLSSGQRFHFFVQIGPGLHKFQKFVWISDLAYYFFTKIYPDRQDIWPKITADEEISVLKVQDLETRY